MIKTWKDEKRDMFKYCHYLTKLEKQKYPDIDYKFQFGLFLSILQTLPERD